MNEYPGSFDAQASEWWIMKIADIPARTGVEGSSPQAIRYPITIPDKWLTAERETI